MYSRGNWMYLSVALVIILTVGRKCRCEVCDLDFHMESASVMLMDGDNASVLCDATCYGSQGSVHVAWRDAQGRQIGFYPGRIFSVSYNRGMMNRLLIIQASSDTAGTFVCSAMRSGELLQQKPLDVLILGNRDNSQIARPVDSVPRRGDITAERITEMDYRPVRSVDRALSRLDIGSLSRKKNGVFGKRVQGEKLDETLIDDGDSEANTFISNLTTSLTNEMHHLSNELSHVLRGWELIGRSAIVSKNGSANWKNMTPTSRGKDDDQNHVLGSSKKPILLLGQLEPEIMNTDVTFGAQESSEDNSEEENIEKNINNGDSQDGFQVDRQRNLSRMKRQGQSPPIVTSDISTTGTPALAESSAGNTTASPTFTNITSDPIGTKSVSENTAISTSSSLNGNTSTPTTDDIITKDGSDRKQESTAKTTDQNGKTNPTCPDQSGNKNTAPDGKQCSALSDFGKYGVLALAISLSVAALLLYTMLMIIFMPRIMARRRNKQDIEGAAYRKKGPGESDISPLTVLECVDTSGSDLNLDKQGTTDMNKSLSLSETSDVVQKDQDSKGNSASVSTFLLRKESQRSEQESKTGVNSKAEDTQAVAEKHATSPPAGETSPGTSLDVNLAKSIKAPTDNALTAEDKPSQQPVDVLSSNLPEPILIDPANSTTPNQSQ